MTHTELIEKLLNQYDQKNLAYGNSAHRTFCRYGKSSYALRLSDKFQRYENLVNASDISCADEAIEDTLGDAITYIYMFAADMYVALMGDNDPESTANMERVRHMMLITACNSEEDIMQMAHCFCKDRIKGDISLVDVIYNMYLDEDTSCLDYVMFAAYLIKLYVERTTPL